MRRAERVRAPQQGKLEDAREDLDRALRRRAAFVLAIAAHRRVERLVLGAWAADVFGNDLAAVAPAFREPLRGDFVDAFARVVLKPDGIFLRSKPKR